MNFDLRFFCSIDALSKVKLATFLNTLLSSGVVGEIASASDTCRPKMKE